MSKGITITNKNIIPTLEEIKKTLEKQEVGSMGKCDNCGQPARVWCGRNLLCVDCFLNSVDKE